MKELQPAKIGVLLVNYKQWELTEKCILSLKEAGDVEIIFGLVDNSSSGEAPEWIRNDPSILLHENNANLGLTAGNNKAFEMVSGENVEYVFVLNNDTEVSPSAPGLLVRCLADSDATGIAAPAISYASDPERIWSAGGIFSRVRMSLKQIYRTVDDLPEHPADMEQVTGCALMMRAGEYRLAGMQDPDLFVYYEDTDLCFRVSEMGKRITLVPQARVLHHVSISVGGVFSPFAVYFTHRNRFIIASRFLKPLEISAFFFYYLFVTFFKTFAYPAKRSAGLVRWMWLGFFHGLTGNAAARPAGLFKENQ